MKRINKKFRRYLAVLLSLCMTVTSFQGVAFAASDSSAEESDILIELDGTALKTAAEDAIRSNELYNAQLLFQEINTSEDADENEKNELTDSKAYSEIFDNSTGSVYSLSDIPYANKASDSNAMRKDAELRIFVKLNGQAARAASDGQAVQTADVEHAATESDIILDTTNYELKGDEKIIFLFMNRSEEDLSFQVDIDGRKSAVTLVESKSTLLAEEEEETVPAPEEIVEEPAAGEEKPADDNSGSVSGGDAADNGGQSQDESGITGETEDDAQTGDEGQITEKPETGDEGQIIEKPETGDEGQIIEKPETGDEGQIIEKPETGDEGQIIEKPETGDEGQNIEKPETGDEGQKEEKPQAGDDSQKEEKPQAEDDSNSGSSSESSSSEEKSSEEKAVVSISSYSVPLVMGPNPDATGDETDNDVSFEEWQEEDEEEEEEEEEEEDSEEYYYDDVEVYDESVDGVDIPTEIYPTVLMKSKRNGIRLLMAKASKGVGTDATTKMAIMPLSAIMETATVDFSEFRVNLYDYKDASKKDSTSINTIIGTNGLRDGQHTDKFLFHPLEYKKYGYHNTYLPYYKGSYSNYGSVAVQGIMADSYSDTGKIDFADQYNVGNFEDGSANSLFPTVSVDVAKAGIDARLGVELGDGVFQKSGNYYVLNAAKSGDGYKGEPVDIKLQSDVLQKTNSVSKGFFPFGNDTFTFGMSLSFDFNLPSDGMATENEEMAFSFAGDDDVWVYIREKNDPLSSTKLAMDLGGIHGLTSGNINFATGIIKHDDVLTKSSNRPAHGSVNWYLYTEEDAKKHLNNADQKTIKRYVGLNRPESGSSENYTLDFYYMERGGGESNCYMDFNMPVIPSKGIKIQKKVQGEMPANATFSFNIVSADTEQALKDYQSDSSETGNVNIETVSIKGAGDKTVNLDVGKHFYVEEISSSDAKVQWNITGSEILPPVNGSRTDIYRVTEDSQGFLLQCTNIYGELTPQIAKRAWKDASVTDESEYDITLEVTGDEIKSTSGTSGSEPVDVVFVMDKSESIEKSDMAAMKKAVVDMSNKFAEGSKVSVIAFSDDGTSGYNHYDYTDAQASKYYEEVSNWTNSNELSEQDLINLDPDGNTHSAAGFLGAKNMLAKNNIQEDGNKKVVIYMTDGDPNIYVGWKEYSKTFDTMYGETAAIAAAKRVLGMLNQSAPSASVYTIGFGYYASYANWLRPEKTTGITKYYPAANIEELEKALTEISSSITTSLKVTNPVVTDTLSENVLLDKINISGQQVAAPEIFIKGGTVSSADDGKGTKLNASLSGTTVSYRYSDDDTTIAEYDTESRKIMWYVGRSSGQEKNELGKETRTLTYRVTAADQKEAPDETGDSDTGTHSGEAGYRSNVEAELTFKDQTENYIFKHPVVNPMTSTLTVSKKVEGGSKEELGGTYLFSVKFEDDKQYTAPDGAEWDDTLKQYTFDLEADESIKFTDLPRGVTYTVEETGAEIQNAEYVLTHISVAGNGTTSADSETDNRPDSLSTDGKVLKGGSEAEFSNTYGKYGYITITKQLEGDESAYPEDQDFRFTVEPQPDASGTYDTTVTVSPTQESKIQIEPEDTDIAFKITETDSKGAWKTTANGSEASTVEITSGETAAFVNAYYKHDIILKKMIEGANPEPDRIYQFDIKLQSEAVLNETDIQLDKGSITDFHELTGESYNYQFTVSLKANEEIEIINLPKSVQKYEITEQKGDNTGSYQTEIYQVTLNDNAQETDKAENTLTSEASQEDTVIFTNQFSRLTGELQIEKHLVKDTTKEKPAKAEKDLTFTFKVTDKATKKWFYASVGINKGESNGTIALDVPTGTYTIEELPSLQYSAADGTTREATVKVAEPGKVAFNNYKSGDGYFTDVSTKINTVNEDGFHPEGDSSEPVKQPKAILPSDKSQKQLTDSDDN